MISLWETGQARTAQIFQHDDGEKSLKECSVLAATLRRTIELYDASMHGDDKVSNATSNVMIGAVNEDGTCTCERCKAVVHTKDSLLSQLEKLDLPPPPLDLVCAIIYDVLTNTLDTEKASTTRIFHVTVPVQIKIVSHFNVWFGMLQILMKLNHDCVAEITGRK